jgi:hypothetical protein
VTSAEINALPDRLRSFVHDLETRCDPAGDIRRLRLIEDENRMLRAKIQEHNSEKHDAERVVERYKADISLLEKELELLRKAKLIAHQMSNSIYNMKQGAIANWEGGRRTLVGLQEEYDELVGRSK